MSRWVNSFAVRCPAHGTRPNAGQPQSVRPRQLMPHMRTVVTFRSTAFNTSESRPYFVNDGCFGDDLARWLITELQSHGVATDSEPDQEDFGWYFGFRPGGTEHQFIIGYRPGSGEESGTWIGWVERRAGLVGSLLGARRRGIRSDSFTGDSRCARERPPGVIGSLASEN